MVFEGLIFLVGGGVGFAIGRIKNKAKLAALGAAVEAIEASKLGTEAKALYDKVKALL